MLSIRYESTEVDRRTWLHVPSGTHWNYVLIKDWQMHNSFGILLILAYVTSLL